MSEKIISILIDTEAFFERNKELKRSSKQFRSNPYELFLFNPNYNKHTVPPTFSFRKKANPRAGIVLVNEKNNIVRNNENILMAKISLEDEDILLNFPLRWDKHYGYFSFTQKGNKLSLIAQSWVNWLNINKLPTPSGSSGKIPEISVLAMLFEWWNRQTNFILKKVFKDYEFLNNCKKQGLKLDYKTGNIIVNENKMYRLAKISVSPDGHGRHTNDWKLFGLYNDELTCILELIKNVIIEMTIVEREVVFEEIRNLQSWLQDNWLEDLNFLKKYYF